jgi:quinoprotein glucose dehydrogenase
VIAQGQAIYEQRCQTCHGADLRGVAPTPSLVDVSMRIGPELLRQVITTGRLSMPGTNLSEAEMSALIAFMANPTATGRGGRGAIASTVVPEGPVVATGGAPGNRPGAFGGGGMAGPAYPEGVSAPSVRYYTDYGMQAVLVKPPYSTLTAYDLNTGTIKWQVPAGGDDPRAVSEGAHDTGFPRVRTGIITTATGLLFQAGLDSKLRVYDSETGKVLWTGPLPAGSIGVPAMYEVNGRQFYVVNATANSTGAVAARGAGAGPAASPNRAYVAFALPQ